MSGDLTINVNLPSNPYKFDPEYTVADLRKDNLKAQSLNEDFQQDRQHVGDHEVDESDVKLLEKALARQGIESDSDSEGRPRGGRSAKSWIQALASVLGKVADQKAQELQQAADAIGGGGDNPSQMIQFQVLSQEFTLMMNTFTGAVKSITEGTGSPAQASSR